MYHVTEYQLKSLFTENCKYIPNNNPLPCQQDTFNDCQVTRKSKYSILYKE